MKKTSALFLAISLALGSVGTAQADWDRHGGGYGRHGGHRHHHGGDRHNWVGPAAILAITGLAIGAAAYSQANAAPVYREPVYVEPPRSYLPPPDSGNWYYCQPYGQYYPYVRDCPEPWQSVMPPR